MSDKQLRRCKTYNLNDLPELTTKSNKYNEEITFDFQDYLEIAKKLEKELRERDPENLAITKEISSACSKAANDVLVKALSEVIKDSEESSLLLLKFLNDTRSVFYNFLWMLRKSNLKLKKTKLIINNTKNIMMWVLSKESHIDFLEDFFMFLTITFESVLYNKVTCLKESDFVQISDMLIALLDNFLCDKKFASLSNLYYSFDCFRPAGFYEGENKEVDLIYYLLIGIEKVFKAENSQLADFAKNCMPNLLDHILDILQLDENKKTARMDLAIEKYFSMFRIYRLLCGHTKPEVAKSFLKNNSDKIKNIFFFILEHYIHFYFSCNSERFEDDEGMIGRIYKILLEIMSMSVIGSDQESFPIIFCSVILQKDIYQNFEKYPPQIQCFTLQFIEKFLNLLGGKKKEISIDFLKECRIVQILFSVPLFEVKNQTPSSSFSYEQTANEIWNSIWTKHILRDRQNLKWIGQGIVESIKFNGEDIPHILKINSWVQSRALTEEDLTEACIDSGVLEALFSVVSFIKRSGSFVTHLADFFMTIKFLLSQFTGTELPNSSYLMNCMIQDNYINDSDVSDLCLDCLTNILKYPNDSNYSKFCILLKQVEDIDLKIKLIGSMQGVLKEKSIKKACQEGFIKAKVLGTLKEQLIKCPIDNRQIIVLWVSVLECVRFLIEDNPYCKKTLHDFDFSKIAMVIRSDSYKLIRADIYMKTIESLLYILFETNNLGKPQVRAVKTPEAIPLVIELLSDCENEAQEYFNHITSCLEDDYNAAHFANYRTTDLLLDAFAKTTSSSLLNFISSTLPLVICHHITPQELSKIIEISKRLSRKPEKKLILFKFLADGIKNSCFSTEHLKFSANHTCLAPTRYFCFRSHKSVLQCDLKTENIIPGKDFSMFFWVYPDNLSRNSVLIMLSGNHNSSLMVSLISGNLVVEYFQEKIIFAVGTNEPLVEKQWNLVGVVFRSLSGILFKNDRGEVEIYINLNKAVTEVKGKVVRPKEFYSKICIGNTENFGNPFIGRIITFYIVKKLMTASHFKQIFLLSFQYNLGFNPDALSTSEDIQADKSLLKSIFENLTFVWHPRNRLPEAGVSQMVIVDECERFNGVTIIEAIAANGGLKIFLPLIKECGVHEKESLISLLKIISGVCIAQSVEMILDEDFFNILTFILEENITQPDVQLVDALINIVGHLEWNKEHYSQSFKSLFLNKKLWKDLDEESNNHYTGTLSLNVKKHFMCDPETLYGIYDQLFYIQKNFCESFLEIWQNLIPEVIEYESVDGILILIFTMFEKNLELLLRFIGMLGHKKYRKDSIEAIYCCVLYLMSQMNSGGIQACFLQFLLKLTEDYCEEVQKERRSSVNLKEDFEFVETLSAHIDRYLDFDIFPETFDELLVYCKKATEQDKKKAEKFIPFINVITKRIDYCENYRLFCEKLVRECEVESFALLIYDREAFPNWLYPLFKKDPSQLEKLSLKIFMTCSKLRNFSKLRTFLTFTASSQSGLSWSLSFYHNLLLHLHSQMFIQNSFDSSKNVVVQFLDFFGILEDIIDPKTSANEEIDLSIYIPLLEDTIEAGKALQLISSSHPPIPYITFDTFCSACREIVYPIKSDSMIYLKDGGYLRLVLKFIFIGLNIEQDQRLILALKKVLKGGDPNSSYLTSSNEQMNRWNSRFNPSSYERYSDFYASFKERRDDSMHALKFLAMYVIAECCEVLKEDRPNPILAFIKEFIRETSAFQEIESKIKPSDSDLEFYFRLLEQNQMWVHSTARSRLDQQIRNRNVETLSHYLGILQQYPTSKIFLDERKNMFNHYNQIKDNSQKLQDLLFSEAWLTNIHFFFIASTSMKLNFLASITSADTLRTTESKYEENLFKIEKFVQQKQENFLKCKNIYEQKLDRSRRMAQKNYKEFSDNFKNLKHVLSGTQIGKFQLRHAVDSIGRMPFIEKKYTDILPGRSRLSLVSLQPIQTLLKDKKHESISEPQVESEEDDSTMILNNLEDVLRFDCERIKLESSVFGFLELSQDYLLFISEGKEKPNEDFYFGSALEFTSVLKKTEKIWKITDFSEIYPRRFIHRHTAVELFLHSGKTFFFNLFSEENCRKVLDFFRGATRKLGKIVKDPSKLFIQYKKSWVKGQISNLEYLMLLNRLSSRSFNDISQYPVFPWILKDYSTGKLVLDDPGIYRDLSLPIGSQTEEGRAEAIRKFTGFIDENVDSFHYGSHYSSAGIVLHYMVRVDPYTGMAKNLQGGIFDVPDRLFYSMQAAWDSGQGTTGDVKELIPELFYLPEVLINKNKENFGTRQDKTDVNDVELPVWATSAIDFVMKHRRALESAYVSAHLHEWIDLIFGYKQKGESSVASFNKFNSLTYEDYYRSVYRESTDLQSIQGFVEQVVHFGQTPVQLLKVPHPQKEKIKPTDFIERWKQIVPELEITRNTGTVLALLSNSSGVYVVKSMNDYIYVILLKDVPIEKSYPNKLEGVRYLKLENWEETVQWNYNLKQSNLVLIRSHEQYSLWGEELIVSGFHIDNSFKVHTLKGALVKSIHHHAGLVTCIICTSSLLFTGSMDTSIASWQMFSQKDDRIRPFRLYLGHFEAIRQLSVQEKYNIVVSLSINGTVLMHEIRSTHCLRKIEHPEPIRLVAVSQFGLIAVYSKKGIKILTFNGSEFVDRVSSGDVKIMKFTESGEYLVYVNAEGIKCMDVVDIEMAYEKNLEEEVECITICEVKEQIAVGVNLDSEFKVWGFK